MTTLENRPNTALLVVDVQNGVVAGGHERDAVVANIATLVEKARQDGVPVVWVQHSDGEGLTIGNDNWQIVPELKPDDAEPHVRKTYPDSFEDTTLETVLSDLGVGRLFVAGAQTDECIRSTLHGAIVRGYDAILVSDAHTTEDLTEWGAPPPDQVIRYVLGSFGRPTRPVDENVRDRILAHPRARELMAEPPPPGVAELRARFPGISDEEMLLRAVMPAAEVDAMLAAGPARRHYNPDLQPTLDLLAGLRSRPGAARVAVSKPGCRRDLRAGRADGQEDTRAG